MSRRGLLKAGAAVGGGLAIAVWAPELAAFAGAPSPKDFVPNAWLTLTADDRILFLLDRAEMGQGVMTSAAMLVAEELEVAPTAMEVRFAGADRAFDNPELGSQMTASSTSTKTCWQPLRAAGAEARERLLSAAARTWSVPLEQCRAEGGAIHHAPSGRSLRYGALVEQAAKERVRRPKLKERGFRVVGQPVDRLDARAKTQGRAEYGLDVQVPGMRTALIVRCPVPGGKVATVKDDAAQRQPGVEHIVRLPFGVAVVAQTFWQAQRAAEQLEVTWEEGPFARFDSESYRKELKRRALEESGKCVRDDGNAERVMEGAQKRLEAVYEVPFVAHATMEPQNATAFVTADHCDIWAPTQGVGSAREVAHRLTGLPHERIRVHPTFLGGGFGRRIAQDYVAEAVALSMATRKPVKVVWTREDDLQHDIYRPAACHFLRAGLATDGQLVAWRHRIATQSIVKQTGPAFLEAALPLWLPTFLKGAMAKVPGALFNGPLADPTSVEGAKELAYEIPNIDVELLTQECGVPVGFWRSVGHSHNAFAVECFLDEAAHAAGVDPLLFRRRMLRFAHRSRWVLELAAQRAGWGSPPPAGVFRGLAQHASYGSYAAAVAEVGIEEEELRVRRVVVALDCGRIVNPLLVRAQLESSVVFGLGAALFHRVDFEKGRVKQQNFYDYPMPRMRDAPKIETHLVENEAPPTGAGEPAVPVIAPAIANAVFAATGKRLRALPLRLTA